ncbi:hypothetical protein Bpfe_008509, partial [Biomphalaria pfeifferi]
KTFPSLVHRKHSLLWSTENMPFSGSHKTFTSLVHRKHSLLWFTENIHFSGSQKTFTSLVHRKHSLLWFTENIPPTEYYGTEFIMFIIPNRIAQGEITAFASNDITTVTLADEKGARGENFFLTKQGDVQI